MGNAYCLWVLEYLIDTETSKAKGFSVMWRPSRLSAFGGWRTLQELLEASAEERNNLSILRFRAINDRGQIVML